MDIAESATVRKTDEEWRASLSDTAYRVLRLGETDTAFKGKYNDFLPGTGHFACAGCNNALYSAAAKFHCTCGWPAFRQAYLNHVTTRGEAGQKAQKAEIICVACESHLGHVFRRESSGKQRHCVNSSSIIYVDTEPGPGYAEGMI